MKRVLSKALVCLALVGTAGLGCHHKCHLCQKNDNCGGCPDGNCGGGGKSCKGHKQAESMTMRSDEAAAASGQAVYPYYQLRGPRDYLQP